jgi:hypothetical protein
MKPKFIKVGGDRWNKLIDEMVQAKIRYYAKVFNRIFEKEGKKLAK